MMQTTATPPLGEIELYRRNCTNKWGRSFSLIEAERAHFNQELFQGCGNVFIDAFYKAYEEFDAQKDLLLPDRVTIPEFLAAAYSATMLRWMEGLQQNRLILVKEKEEIVACAAFERDGDRVYTAQIAVDPNVQGSGIGRILIECGMNLYSDVAEISLVTRILNPAVTFYEHIGFLKTHLIHSGLDPDIYQGYIKTL